MQAGAALPAVKEGGRRRDRVQCERAVHFAFGSAPAPAPSRVTRRIQFIRLITACPSRSGLWKARARRGDAACGGQQPASARRAVSNPSAAASATAPSRRRSAVAATPSVWQQSAARRHARGTHPAPAGPVLPHKGRTRGKDLRGAIVSAVCRLLASSAMASSARGVVCALVASSALSPPRRQFSALPQRAEGGQVL